MSVEQEARSLLAAEFDDEATACGPWQADRARWQGSTLRTRAQELRNNGHINADDQAAVRAITTALLRSSASQSFQDRVQPWMMECFGPEIAGDRIERNHRFIEEALELVQANGCTRSEAHQLVDYTFNRPTGEPLQEAGGVMVTLAALCLANGLDMHAAGETELARISAPGTIERIRAKQAAKPKHSPLPAASSASRDEVLEEAAKVAEEYRHFSFDGKAVAVSKETAEAIAAAIRNLKSAPGEQSG